MNSQIRKYWNHGLWFSVPVSAIVLYAWLTEISPTGINLLIGAGALSLPWGLAGGFATWLFLSVGSQFIDIDLFATLFWAYGMSAVIGSHINSMLLFAPRPLPGNALESLSTNKAKKL